MAIAETFLLLRPGNICMRIMPGITHLALKTVPLAYIPCILAETQEHILLLVAYVYMMYNVSV